MFCEGLPIVRLLTAGGFAAATVLAGLGHADRLGPFALLAVVAVAPLTVGLWAIAEDRAALAGAAFALVALMTPTLWWTPVLNVPLLVLALGLVTRPVVGGLSLWELDPAHDRNR
jgi:hypothetical protein